MSDVNVSGNPAEPTATPTATPAPAISGAPAPQLATPAAPAPAATPQVPEGYIPSSVLRYRLEETREAARREAQQEMAELRAQHEATQRQLHALVGVTPQGNPELDAVRQQFGSIYPGLAKLEERYEQLEALLERSNDIDVQQQHYWNVYGRQNLDRLYEKASQTYGSPINEEGKQALHTAFTGFVSSSPERASRYVNDPSIVDEFWGYFTKNFIDPARRAATATVVGRTEGVMPKDTPGGPPRAMPAAQSQSLDEKMAGAWANYEMNRNAKG